MTTTYLYWWCYLNTVVLTNIIHCQLSVNVGFKISWDPGCSDEEIELKIKRDLPGS